MPRIYKPMKGCKVYASSKHMTRSAGDLIGWCEKVDGNVCIFKPPGRPDTDRFIWQFKDGQNGWYEFIS